MDHSDSDFASVEFYDLEEDYGANVINKNKEKNEFTIKPKPGQ